MLEVRKPALDTIAMTMMINKHFFFVEKTHIFTAKHRGLVKVFCFSVCFLFRESEIKSTNNINSYGYNGFLNGKRFKRFVKFGIYFVENKGKEFESNT